MSRPGLPIQDCYEDVIVLVVASLLRARGIRDVPAIEAAESFIAELAEKYDMRDSIRAVVQDLLSLVGDGQVYTGEDATSAPETTTAETPPTGALPQG